MMLKLNRKRNAFTLIELLLVIAVIAILSAMAIALWITNRMVANETSALNSMRLINSAETTYRLRHNVYADLPTLLSDKDIPRDIAGVGKSGYTFLVQGTGPAAYVAAASPSDLNAGKRFFYSDEVGAIFQSSPTTTSAPTTDYSGQTPPGFGPIGN